MPELPEVETIKRTLEPVVGSTIKKIRILREDFVRRMDYSPVQLEGQVIQGLYRRGKFLVLEVNPGQNLVLHLGMTGRVYLYRGEPPAEKHIHFILSLKGERHLVFQDPRRFGGVWFVCDITAFFAHLGCEPLTRELNTRTLGKMVRGRKVSIKTLLLNQALICGIGNIYADEALFHAGIRPDRGAGTLSEDEIRRLSRAIKTVLWQGIEQRGTTFRDYRDGENQMGSFQHHLQVYGREKQPCSRCGALIERRVINGRSSHFCSRCQL